MLHEVMSTTTTDGSTNLLPLLIASAGICAIIGAAIGNGKTMGGGGGFLLGFLLGPIGVLIVAVSGSHHDSTLSRIQSRPTGPGWHPDPLGRFDGRYYDGSRWTQHVGRVEPDGSRRTLEDPL